MTMYKDLTTQQKLGLSDAGMAELKAATIDELVKLGFSDFLKADSDDTYDAIFEQMDADPELADRVSYEVHNEYADNYTFCKETYHEFVEAWVESKAKTLHGE